MLVSVCGYMKVVIVEFSVKVVKGSIWLGCSVSLVVLFFSVKVFWVEVNMLV